LQRYLHSVTFANNKLYILGGFPYIGAKEFFILILYFHLIILKIYYHGTSVNNKIIFLYGGDKFGNIDDVLVHAFNTQNNS